VILLKTRIIDKAFVHAKYLENIGKKKAHPRSSKQKEHWESSKEGKNK